MSGATPVAGDPGVEARVAARLAGTRFGPVRWFAAIDSTNRYAADATKAGDANGLVVVADEQAAGRGRLGRRWDAPPGASLLVSVVVRLDDARAHLPLVTPAAALAAAGALEALAGIDARLKWPNDLVVDDRKLAGVLAEVGHGNVVVVGMGLNVDWPGFPDELAPIATACNLLSPRPVDRADLLVEWLTRYDALLDQLAHADGRAALRDSVATRSATLGRTVRVELPDRTLTGVASALLADGTLEVTRADGVREVVGAGDVVHLRPTATNG
jgi:BirA family transcriptional regulator, biotin operon repressor / biotin---[acetyl-CoA-carboxylase] ligase